MAWRVLHWLPSEFALKSRVFETHELTTNCTTLCSIHTSGTMHTKYFLFMFWHYPYIMYLNHDCNERFDRTVMGRFWNVKITYIVHYTRTDHTSINLY